MSGIPATLGLIGLLFAGYVAQVATGSPLTLAPEAGGWLTAAGNDTPAAIVAGQYYRLIAVMFLHAGVLHLVMDCVGVYLFGSFVERTYGRVQVLALFFVTGFVASVAAYAASTLASDGRVGASGAVFGLSGVYVAYAFRHRRNPSRRGMVRLALAWVLVNVILGATIAASDLPAHAAGFAAGFIAGALLEGGSARSSRRAVSIATCIGLVAIGVAVTFAKTNQLTPGVASVSWW